MTPGVNNHTVVLKRGLRIIDSRLQDNVDEILRFCIVRPSSKSFDRITNTFSCPTLYFLIYTGQFQRDYFSKFECFVHLLLFSLNFLQYTVLAIEKAFITNPLY